MAYFPTPGPLIGEQWIPSNGSEGSMILSSLCSNCARDKATGRSGLGPHRGQPNAGRGCRVAAARADGMAS
jgi:hypothetical protein